MALPENVQRTGKSPLEYDQAMVGPTWTAIILHDTETDLWYTIKIPTADLQIAKLVVVPNIQMREEDLKVIAGDGC